MRTLGSKVFTRPDGTTYTDIDGTVVSGQEALRQILQARLLLLRGTWELDTRAGLFDLRTLPGASPEGLGMIERMVAEDIRELDEVIAVTSVEAVYTGANRELRINIEVQTIYGDLGMGVTIA